MKKFFNCFFKTFVNYFCSIWFGVLVAILLIYPLKMIFEMNIFYENIAMAILLTLGMTFCLFIAFYKMGYQNRNTMLLRLLSSLLILFLLQHLVTFSLNFYGPHFSGGTSYLAEAILAPNEEFPEIKQEMLHAFLAAFQIIFYLPVSLLGNYLGVKARAADIKEIQNTQKDRI